MDNDACQDCDQMLNSEFMFYLQVVTMQGGCSVKVIEDFRHKAHRGPQVLPTPNSTLIWILLTRSSPPWRSQQAAYHMGSAWRTPRRPSPPCWTRTPPSRSPTQRPPGWAACSQWGRCSARWVRSSWWTRWGGKPPCSPSLWWASSSAGPWWWQPVRLGSSTWAGSHPAPHPHHHLHGCDQVPAWLGRRSGDHDLPGLHPRDHQARVKRRLWLLSSGRKTTQPNVFFKNQVMTALGIVCCYIMGRSLAWNWLSLVSCVFLVLFTFGLYYIPESPPWLVYNEEEDLAFKSMAMIRCTMCRLWMWAHVIQVDLSSVKFFGPVRNNIPLSCRHLV